MKVEWDKIQGATSYELELGLVTSTDEDGTNHLKVIKKATTEDDTYTFDDLGWDEKYGVRIKCIGNNKESEYYQVKVRASTTQQRFLVPRLLITLLVYPGLKVVRKSSM